MNWLILLALIVLLIFTFIPARHTPALQEVEADPRDGRRPR